jgi:hypothetical protein
MSGADNAAKHPETGIARIIRIELRPIFVPFLEAVKQTTQSGAGGLGMAIVAEEAWLGEDFVICRLIADDGSAGVGEAFVRLPETGVSVKSRGIYRINARKPISAASAMSIASRPLNE